MLNRFFKIKSEISIAKIAKYLNVEIVSKFNEDLDELFISKVTTLSNADQSSLTFFDNKKYLNELISAKALAVIIDPKFQDHAEHIDIKLLTNQPYYTYTKALEYLYESTQDDKPAENLVSSTAKIAENVKIGKNCIIEDYVTIAENVEIGDNCYIASGSAIKYGVVIGNNVKIAHNVTLQHCQIGDNCIIHSGARIGQEGFGFAFFNGVHNKIPHISAVIIEDNVEIGANTTIDRGSLKETIIGNGTKIDNLVQIGHNVQIGKNCIIVAQTGIAGSTQIGDYTVIGGQVGISGHLNIGNQVQIAAQSGVVKNVGDKEIIGGSPAVPIKDWHRQTIIMRKLMKKD